MATFITAIVGTPNLTETKVWFKVRKGMMKNFGMLAVNMRVSSDYDKRWELQTYWDI